jgi:hypothetical protein
MSRVECIGTIADTGSTVLVMARIIIAPPFEKAAFATAARKLPTTIAYNA